jgi:hypothetical protein
MSCVCILHVLCVEVIGFFFSNNKYNMLLGMNNIKKKEAPLTPRFFWEFENPANALFQWLSLNTCDPQEHILSYSLVENEWCDSGKDAGLRATAAIRCETHCSAESGVLHLAVLWQQLCTSSAIGHAWTHASLIIDLTDTTRFFSFEKLASSW